MSSLFEHKYERRAQKIEFCYAIYLYFFKFLRSRDVNGDLTSQRPEFLRFSVKDPQIQLNFLNRGLGLFFTFLVIRVAFWSWELQSL